MTLHQELASFLSGIQIQTRNFLDKTKILDKSKAESISLLADELGYANRILDNALQMSPMMAQRETIITVALCRKATIQAILDRIAIDDDDFKSVP